MNKVRSVQLQAYLNVTGTTRIIIANILNIHMLGPKRVNEKAKNRKLNIGAI